MAIVYAPGLSVPNYAKSSTVPVIAFGGSSTGITASTARLNYTRICDLCFITMTIRLTSKGTATGNLTITGFPFPCATDNDVVPTYITQCNTLASTVTAPPTGSMLDANTLRLHYMNAGAATVLTDAHFTDTSIIRMSGAYRIADGY